MDFCTARDNLIKLLCVSVETLTDDELRKLVKKRYKQWHPDKNKNDPERYQENFVLLNTSYKVFKNGGTSDDSQDFSEPGCSGFTPDDLFCDETWDPDWETGNDTDSDYNSTPFDDEFFNASPKKNFAVPETLRLFFRSKTNRRAGKLFMLFCFQDSLHRKCLEELSKNDLLKSFMVFSARTNKDIYCVLIVTKVDFRLIDLKKLSRKHSLHNIELFYAVNVLKLLDKLLESYSNPVYTWGETIERKVKEESSFNNKQLVDFALSNEYTEVLTLMYEYAHLADPCDREKYTKEHEDDHLNELLNAKKFVKLPDRKRVCKNAIDCVFAKLYRQLTCITNTTWLEMRSRDCSERLMDVKEHKVFGEAYYLWKYCIGKELFSSIMSFIVAVFTDSVCKYVSVSEKKRYVCLIGPYNCGKTTLAAAICKFFEGVNINLNVSRDRMPFYIGSAIGKRFVLFDDVKGYEPLIKGLPSGNGLSNLDDLREHLDGLIEVQLEKKNQNPVCQLFPQGIITMNQYKMPNSLKLRLHRINFPPSRMYKVHKYRITMDTIFIAMAMDNLIPCDKDFIAYASSQKDAWIAEHNKTCKCMVSMFLLWVEL